MNDPARPYVGTSGWYYDHWEGVLYPPGLPKARRLSVYAGRCDADALNGQLARLGLRQVEPPT